MYKVSFIGSGNVATHLATKLYEAGVHVSQILSVTPAHADALAQKVGAQGISNFDHLDTEYIDALIIAVSDDVLPEISNQLAPTSCIIAHTSGTAALDTFKSHQNHGVFYPLQTFSKNKEINIKATPFCIEGSSNAVASILKSLADVISNRVEYVDSETRKNIHIAAVFACNFSNHMLTIADELLDQSNLNLSILQPLVEETIQKAFSAKPKDVQTGPASRNDKSIMKDHLSRLSSDDLFQSIYKAISHSIIKTKNE